MSESALALSDALAAAVASAGASVVRVEARRRGGASGIRWSEDVVVTADHVIEEEESVVVGLEGGGTVGATLAGRDRATDIAVLRLTVSPAGPTSPPAAGTTPLANWIPIPWADPTSLRVGTLALSLTRPGRTVRASLGVVSAAGGEWRSPAGGRIERYIESDCALRPGFSGGALVDARGRFIGMNTAGLLRGTAIALPPATLAPVVESILRSGRVERGFLGVGTTPVRLTRALEAAAGQSSGLVVVAVAEGGPAEASGVIPGDVIIALDGQPVRRPSDLVARMMEAQAGARASLRLLRAGEPRELDVIIGVRGASVS